jgi:hypothetical protein
MLASINGGPFAALGGGPRDVPARRHRGFGFDNAGASGTVAKFLDAPVFQLTAAERADVEQFVLAFDSTLQPVVRQQVTVNAANRNRSDITGRLNLLVAWATVTPQAECELVAKGVLAGRTVGWVMNSEQQFVPNDTAASALGLTTLLQQASDDDAPVTFTCVPPGNGTRIGRDADQVCDRNEG